MIPKKSLESVLYKSIILTITAPNDNAKSISVQVGGGTQISADPLTLSQPRGADYAHQIALTSLGFSDLPTVLNVIDSIASRLWVVSK